METAVHLEVRWFAPVAETIQLAVFGGPTFFAVEQDLVTAVGYDHTYPFDEASFASASTMTRSASAIGFHAGADVGYFFSDVVGVGVLLRYSAATVNLPAENDRVVPVDAGGFQVGGGGADQVVLTPSSKGGQAMERMHDGPASATISPIPSGRAAALRPSPASPGQSRSMANRSTAAWFTALESRPDCQSAASRRAHLYVELGPEQHRAVTVAGCPPEQDRRVGLHDALERQHVVGGHPHRLTEIELLG